MKAILDLLRGIVIGIANIIPGVSGGTMAVSMGIYDKLIGAVSNLFKDFKRNLLFLLPLLIGMGVGIVGFGKLLEYLLEYHVLATCLTFVGLILGGVPVLWVHLKGSVSKKPGGRLGAAEVACFALLLAVGAVKAMSLSVGSIVILFLLGVIASATMVIPGVSGSMVLMVLGYYSTILAQVTGLLDSLLARDWAALGHCVGLLAPFGVGVVLGIFLIAKLIEWLFKKFPSQTYAAIIGLIVASPFGILYSSGALESFSTIGLIVGLVLGAAGGWVTWLMGEKEPA